MSASCYLREPPQVTAVFTPKLLTPKLSGRGTAGNVIKLLGFLDYQATDESFFDLFARMRTGRLIP
jgi:hypothetical protein